MKIQRKAAMHMVAVMFQMGSLAFSQVWGLQLFLPKKMKYGTFRPVWRNVPAEASMRRKPTQSFPLSKPAETIIDLETKPLNSGKAEIERPPIRVSTKVTGIFL